MENHERTRGRTSTLSHLQFPQGLCSTTSHLTLRARHDTQALAARRLVFFCASAAEPETDPVVVAVESDLFLPTGLPLSPPAGFLGPSAVVDVVVVGGEDEEVAEVEKKAAAVCDCDSGGGEPAVEESEPSDMMSN